VDVEQFLMEASEDYTPSENPDVLMPNCLSNDNSGYIFIFQIKADNKKSLYTGLY
jgi:hypothetical protein